MNYDSRHGGAYDRGSADRYYRRPFKPHFYLGATGMSTLIEEDSMTDTEISAYSAGYDEEYDQKDYR